MPRRSMIISSQHSQQILSIQANLKPSNLSPNIPLAVGENIEAVVLSHDRQQVLLQIKNTVIKANSHSELQKGDRLMLLVDQLQPSLILKITAHETADTQKINEFLRMYRSNPDALKDLLISAKDLLSGDSLEELTHLIGKKDIQAMLNVLDKLIMTKDSMANPLFLKNYVEYLGLTLEKILRKALSDPTVLKNETLIDNFKRLLLKIEEAVRGFPVIPNETDTAQKLKPFFKFIELGGKVIEHLQIVNCVAMDRDQLFVIQIPFQCPDGIRMQDIFIETENHENAQDEEKQYHIVLFLDMDALGEMACDVSVKNKALNCTIKSDNAIVCDFLSPLLAKLQEQLSASGYDCRSIKCICDHKIASWKQNFISKYNVFSGNTINLCI